MFFLNKISEDNKAITITALLLSMAKKINITKNIIIKFLNVIFLSKIKIDNINDITEKKIKLDPKHALSVNLSLNNSGQK